MREKIQNTAACFLVALVGILLFYWFKTANDETIRILLAPHAKLTEIYFHIPLVYINGIGYTSLDGTFAIGRECMGSTFIIMMFTMSGCLFVKYFKGINKLTWIIASLILSIVIGVLVSCIRIIGSIPFVVHPKFALLHSSIGISLYLFVLTTSYAVLKKLIRGDRNEKSV